MTKLPSEVSFILQLLKGHYSEKQNPGTCHGNHIKTEFYKFNISKSGIITFNRYMNARYSLSNVCLFFSVIDVLNSWLKMTTGCYSKSTSFTTFIHFVFLCNISTTFTVSRKFHVLRKREKNIHFKFREKLLKWISLTTSVIRCTL